MKLPYKRGDSFALPLGNGQFARSCIVDCEHRVVVLAITVGADAPLVVRVSDEALILHRWKRDGRVHLSERETPHAQNAYWMHAARAERLAAAALGAPHPRERRVRVLELLGDTASQTFADIDDDAVLALTGRLDNRSIEMLCATIVDHPGVSVRLHGASAEHLPDLLATPLQRLTLTALPSSLPDAPGVRHLTLIGAMQIDQVAHAFPNLESLSIDATGAAIDIAPLRTLCGLQSFTCAGAAVDGRAFAKLRNIQALRISRVTGIHDCASLASLPLRTLALEHLHELRSLRRLNELAKLEQLQLLGTWQFDIADVEWALDLETLARAEIDIGGRRKNVELYRRASWAYPWRFPPSY